jgi:rhodanese-related sulfurtransferase
MRFTTIAVLCAMAVLCGWSVKAAEEVQFAHISLADLKRVMADKKVTLIDCNGAVSYNRNHIPGAISFEASQAKLGEVLPAAKDALIVAYCGNEHCPAYKKGATAAAKLGYTNVQHFSPGIMGWMDAGEKTEAVVGAK